MRSIVALVTPFKEDLEIDFPAFCELIEWHIQEGTDAIVICGTTGEAPTLSFEERIELFKTAVAVSAKRIPIIAGTGCNDTRFAVTLTQEAMSCGVDTGLVIFPYYNRPNFEGCMAHFNAIGKVGLPLILYHHPVRTGIRFSAEQLAKLCEVESVIGIKEASSDLNLALDFMQLSTKDLFSGDDTLALPYRAIGAKGIISIVANIIPKEWRLQRYEEFAPLAKAMVMDSNPQCVKYALSLMKKCQPHLRLPLIEPSNEVKRLIEEAMSAKILPLAQPSAL